jgi:hypothetical protein
MAAAGGSSQTGGSKARKVMDVNTLLRDLRTGEQEFDNLVIEEDVTIDEEPDLLAATRILMDKPFSAANFEDTMRFAWALAKKTEFRNVGNNTFILHLSCLGDWKKVVKEGLWLFRNSRIVIKS